MFAVYMAEIKVGETDSGYSKFLTWINIMMILFIIVALVLNVSFMMWFEKNDLYVMAQHGYAFLIFLGLFGILLCLSLSLLKRVSRE